MPRYLTLALNGPTGGEGDEAALHQWYQDVHLPAFKAIEAVKSAPSCKVTRGNLPGMDAWPVAAYEIVTDDIAAVSAQLAKDLQQFHPPLDRSRSAPLCAIQISGDE